MALRVFCMQLDLMSDTMNKLPCGLFVGQKVMTCRKGFKATLYVRCYHKIMLFSIYSILYLFQLNTVRRNEVEAIF